MNPTAAAPVAAEVQDWSLTLAQWVKYTYNIKITTLKELNEHTEVYLKPLERNYRDMLRKKAYGVPRRKRYHVAQVKAMES